MVRPHLLISCKIHSFLPKSSILPCIRSFRLARVAAGPLGNYDKNQSGISGCIIER